MRAAIGPGEPFPPAWWRHVDRRRLDAIGAFVRDLDADVVALEEVPILVVDGEVLDFPLELARLTGLEARYSAVGHFAVVEPETGRAVGACLWGNAILTRLHVTAAAGAGLPLAADDDLVEPEGAPDPLRGGRYRLAGVRYADAPTGSREPRSALRVSLESTLGPLDVVATHLTHVGTGQRRSQAAFLAAFADAGPAAARAVVVTGDLNAPIEADALAPLRDRFVDAFEATGTPPGDPGRISCGPVSLDHILVRGLTAVACAVDRSAGDLSDHWPVVATFAP